MEEKDRKTSFILHNLNFDFMYCIKIFIHETSFGLLMPLKRNKKKCRERKSKLKNRELRGKKKETLSVHVSDFLLFFRFSFSDSACFPFKYYKIEELL